MSKCGMAAVHFVLKVGTVGKVTRTSDMNVSDKKNEASSCSCVKIRRRQLCRCTGRLRGSCLSKSETFMSSTSSTFKYGDWKYCAVGGLKWDEESSWYRRRTLKRRSWSTTGGSRDQRDNKICLANHKSYLAFARTTDEEVRDGEDVEVDDPPC